MEDIEILEKIQSEFTKFKEWGYNDYDAKERCVREIPNPPYIYTDNYGDASYCHKGDFALIFGSGIYKKIN